MILGLPFRILWVSLLLLPGAVHAIAAPQEASPPAAIVIRNARIVSLHEDVAPQTATLVIRGRRIASVSAGGDTGVPDGARVVDAGGRFLLPGLADMHVHASEPDLALLLAHGVTTAREMNGSPAHLRWRAEIAAGERTGPRLVVASPLLAGEPVPGFRHELVESPNRATSLVADLAAAGYDLVKVYDGLDPDTYTALVRAAAEHGLPVAGHIPEQVGLLRVLGARQEIEHVEKIVHASRGPLTATTLPFLAGHIRDAGVWVTPTLAAQRALSLAGSDAYHEALAAPSTRWVAPSILEWWRSLDGKPSGHRESAPAGDPAGFYRLQCLLTMALYRAGVPMLAGTDTPNPLMVPGLSLVDEIEALVEAGMSPREALGLATVAPSRYRREVLGEDDDGGVIRSGARADLVLVEDDPLDDLETLRRPWAVVAAGRYLDRDDLDRLLDDVEAIRHPQAADGDTDSHGATSVIGAGR